MSNTLSESELVFEPVFVFPLSRGCTPLAQKKLRKLGPLLSLFALASFFVSVPVSVFASVSVVSTSPTSVSCSVANKSYNVTVQAGEILVAEMLSHAPANHLGMTLNGVSMTLGNTSVANGVRRSLFYMYAPSLGSNLLEATVDTASYCIGMGSSVVSGVDINVVPQNFIREDLSSPYLYDFSTPVVGSLLWMTGNNNNAGIQTPANVETIIGSQPESTGFGTMTVYSTVSLNATTTLGWTAPAGSTYMNGFVLTPSTGGGGGGGATTTVTSFLPATLLSIGSIIVNPVTTSSYSFVSPATGNLVTQGGLVFISHLESVTPVVTWGGHAMIFYQKNDTPTFGYVTSVYHTNAPPSSASIVITGITASSTNFIQASVWNNGNLVDATAIRNVFPGSLASVDLASINVAPIGIIGTFLTPNVSSFTRMSQTTLTGHATNTDFSFNTLYRLCSGYAAFNDCLIGYSPNGLTFTEYGNLIAVSMYSIASTTIPVVPGVTPIEYVKCDTFDLACYISNAFQYLFTPSTDATTKFNSLTLASSSPFSYAYDFGKVYDELFNSATTSVIGITVPFKYYGSGSSTITIISAQMIENVPFAGFIRTLISWLLWFMFAQLVYMQIMKVHNKEHTV